MKEIQSNNYHNNSIWGDIKGYLINNPEVKTVVKFRSPEDRERYRKRILERLNISVSDYSVLNIHKIGIEVPGQYVFEQLLLWDGQSEYWPNNLACMKRVDNSLEHILVYFLGCEKISFKFLVPGGIKINPLFNMRALKFQLDPPPSNEENARYLLYKCTGGYPIGIYALFIRNPILELKETEKTQLFLLVAFDFYGKKRWFYNNVINPIWEKIHNRVTGNILNRIKNVVENKFNDKISELKGNE